MPYCAIWRHMVGKELSPPIEQGGVALSQLDHVGTGQPRESSKTSQSNELVASGMKEGGVVRNKYDILKKDQQERRRVMAIWES